MESTIQMCTISRTSSSSQEEGQLCVTQPWVGGRGIWVGGEEASNPATQDGLIKTMLTVLQCVTMCHTRWPQENVDCVTMCYNVLPQGGLVKRNVCCVAT